MQEKIIEIKQSDEVSLKEILLTLGDWFKYLISKWKIITIFGIVGGGIGFLYAKSKDPIYTAVTTFVLEEGDSGGAVGQYAGLASMVGISMGDGGGIFKGDNIFELYKSRKMIEKTLLTTVIHNGKKQLLIDSYIAFNNLKDRWKDDPKLNRISFNSSERGFNRLQDSIMGVIVKDINKNYLKVSKPDAALSLIIAQIKAKDEFFAKIFNEQIVNNVNEFYLQTKTKKSMNNIAIFQQKTDSIRAVMNGAMYSAAIVADETPNLNVTKQVKRTAPLQRSQFAIETNKLMLSELIKNLELSKISLRKEAPLIQIVDTPVLPLEKERFGKLKGIVVGGIFFGFLCSAFLILKRLFKKVLE